MGGNMNMGQSNGNVGLNDVEFVSQRPHRNSSIGQSNGNVGLNDVEFVSQRPHRNSSIISFGGGRNMSFASEASYGRAMSGLSALSIDWENMDDFDINVDHSAHINNGGLNPSSLLAGANDGILDPKPIGGGGGGGRRSSRSSLRQSFIVGTNGSNDNDAHVSFKV